MAGVRLICQVLPNTSATIMKPSTALDAHRDAIRRIVASHHASNARVFGSVVLRAGDLHRFFSIEDQVYNMDTE